MGWDRRFESAAQDHMGSVTPKQAKFGGALFIPCGLYSGCSFSCTDTWLTMAHVQVAFVISLFIRVQDFLQCSVGCYCLPSAVFQTWFQSSNCPCVGSFLVSGPLSTRCDKRPVCVLLIPGICVLVSEVRP